eukprot:7760463-Heterocapsa_arctica.AAC.1
MSHFILASLMSSNMVWPEAQELQLAKTKVQFLGLPSHSGLLGLAVGCLAGNTDLLDSLPALAFQHCEDRVNKLSRVASPTIQLHVDPLLLCLRL